MKKQDLNLTSIVKSILVIALFTFFTQNTFAQKNNIKASFFTKGKSSIGYERALNGYSSVIGSFNFYSYAESNSGFFSNNEKYTNNGTRVSGEYRLYFSSRNKALEGFYIAANFFMGKHHLTYSTRTNSSPFGLLLGLTFLTVDVANDGDLDGNYFNPSSTIKGETNVLVKGTGLKFGYQKRWKRLSLDMGFNLTNNSAGNAKGIPLNNYSYKKFRGSIDGRSPEVYFGLGFAM